MSAPSFERQGPPTTLVLRPGPPAVPSDVEALVAVLIDEMLRAWRGGERPRAEDFLARHPELMRHPEAAAELIYEEVCLRQEHGEEVSPEEVLQRFPQWRAKLEVLFDCQRLLGPSAAAPHLPAPGEMLGDFLVLAELGRGGHGSVFLATQVSLADRPVVLKLTPFDGYEHLSLARLQHTHIVPLHSVQDFADRSLRALCMPFFGGATLAQLLAALRDQPPALRTSRDLLGALDRLQEGAPVALPSRGPAREVLARASYVRAVCWIGACLAEALQYAHECGIVHLDLKPSNVLLTADGLPMLLDFHVARAPLAPGALGAPAPSLFGGTLGYMSPEQEVALKALGQGLPVPCGVDGRSDVYSLGVLLREALGGALPGPGRPPPLRRANPEVSPGLEDVLGKCLAADPDRRYADMAGLADDLRRHLAHLPLRGVRNRSVRERWRKWRQRRPNGLAAAGMLAAVLAAVCALGIGTALHFADRSAQARGCLRTGQAQLTDGQHTEAAGTFQRGLSLVRGVPWQSDLAEDLSHCLRAAEDARAESEQARAVQALHSLADRARFLHGVAPGPSEELRRLESACRALWERRGLILERVRAARAPELERQARHDLLDLGILWADLLHSAPAPAGAGEARKSALAVLDQAEATFGPSPVLDEERRLHSRGVGRAPGLRAAGQVPDTAWGHYALGRSLLRGGDLPRAAEELERAVRLQPHGLWPNFYRGVCAYRLGRHEEAVAAFSVCIGSAPEAAPCYYNRALAHAAQGRTDRALLDYDHALRLDPSFAAAALNRGMLHFREGRHAPAAADLRRALRLGADPALVHYDLALVEQARGEWEAARAALRRALEHQPTHEGARRLLQELQQRP